MEDVSPQKLESLKKKVAKGKPYKRQSALLKALGGGGAAYGQLWRLCAARVFSDDPSSEVARWQYEICMDGSVLSLAGVTDDELITWMKSVDEATLAPCRYLQGIGESVVANAVFANPEPFEAALPELPATLANGVTVALRLLGRDVVLPENFADWLVFQFDSMGCYPTIAVPKGGEWETGRSGGSKYDLVNPYDAANKAHTADYRRFISFFMTNDEWDTMAPEWVRASLPYKGA